MGLLHDIKGTLSSSEFALSDNANVYSDEDTSIHPRRKSARRKSIESSSELALSDNANVYSDEDTSIHPRRKSAQSYVRDTPPAGSMCRSHPPRVPDKCPRPTFVPGVVSGVVRLLDEPPPRRPLRVDCGASTSADISVLCSC